MKKIILSLIILVLAFSANAQSELMVFEDWSNTNGSQNFFYKNVVKTDLSSNTYVLGATVNDSNNYDILLAKYDRRGTLTWMRQYNGAGDGDDMGTGLYVDGSGNVYVTGTVTDTNSKNVVTIKYNSAGTQQWLKIYNGAGNDFDSGSDIITDGSGNVYVTGTSTNASSYTSVFAAKYNSSGTQQWVTNYNVAANLNDAGVKISLIGYNVAIAGVHQSSSTSYNYFTAQFNTANGNFVMIMSSGAYNVYGVDQVNDMVRDASGNIYIAGATPVTGQGYDYYVVKLNSSLGLTWQRTYNGADSLDDFAQGVRVDGSGNVYTTGYSTTLNEGRNITTIKYNSSGTQQWIQHYNDTLDGDDEAAAMAMDASGNIYVTGYISTETDNADYFTMKYNPSGTLLWSIHGDGNAHLNDKATNIVIASDGGIIITGESETEAGAYEYRTIKYVEKQVITPTDFDSEEPQGSFEYYANKGQLINTADSLVPEIKYYTNNSSPRLYIKENSFSFVFAKSDTSVSIPDTLHRIDVTFQKGKTGSKTYPMEERRDYLNYFLGHCPDGITEVRGNQKLITSDLYENIDLMYTSNQNGIKYYYIVKPGGDPTELSLEFTGATSFYLDSISNELTINSSIGSITFDQPTIYQLDSANNIVNISGWTADWKTNGASNIFTFNIGMYDSSKPLIIQVDRGNTSTASTTIGNLDWSVYYGGLLNDEFLDIKCDGNSNTYITGYTSAVNFPLNHGYQTTNHGNTDIIIVKFASNGVNWFSTYYGGLSADVGYSILPSKTNGNIFVVGRTLSPDFPIPSQQPFHAFNQSNLSGNMNGYILEFNPNGTQRIWATHYGADNEYFSSVAEDELGNIYAVGRGSTSSPLLNLAGAYYNSTVGNGLIVKFSKYRQRKWATLFVTGGGIITSVKTDGDNNVFITGSVNVDGMPVVNPGGGAYCASRAGGYDAFVARFNSDNTITWSTYIGGSGDDDGASIDAYSGVTKTASGYVYITGRTTSTNYPTINSGWPAYYNNTLIGFSNTLISKFNGFGALVWSTYHGYPPSNSYDGGRCIVVSGGNEVYVTGYTHGLTIQQFAGAYLQTSISNSNLATDAYLLAFRKDNNERIWSTFFGGSRGEVGNAIAIDPLSRLYLVGEEYSATGDMFPLPTVQLTGAYWQPNNAGVGHSDGFISRFDMSLATYSVNEVSEASPINIYPNPSSETIFIETEVEGRADIKIVIYNSMGQTMLVVNEKSSGGTFNKGLSIAAYNNGLYVIEVKVGMNSYFKKIIKQ